MPDDRELVIVDRVGDAPYSKGLMAQTLMATGLSPMRAYGMAAAIARELEDAADNALTLGRLRAIARETLGDEEGDEIIARYRQWQSLRRLEVPLVILIGGATGVGKSTLATEVAHRLGITRVASTDMVRQVMRAFFSIDLMPAIHYSSFEAAESVRVPAPARERPEPRGVHRADEGGRGRHLVAHRARHHRGAEPDRRGRAPRARAFSTAAAGRTPWCSSSCSP